MQLCTRFSIDVRRGMLVDALSLLAEEALRSFACSIDQALDQAALLMILTNNPVL